MAASQNQIEGEDTYEIISSPPSPLALTPAIPQPISTRTTSVASQCSKPHQNEAGSSLKNSAVVCSSTSDHDSYLSSEPNSYIVSLSPSPRHSVSSPPPDFLRSASPSNSDIKSLQQQLRLLKQENERLKEENKELKSQLAHQDSPESNHTPIIQPVLPPFFVGPLEPK